MCLLKKLIECLPNTSNYKANNIIMNNEFLTNLDNKENLLKCIIDDLGRYLKSSFNQRKTFNEKNVDILEIVKKIN